MPRTARFVIPGQLYHVTQRGNFKQDVFEEDQDRAVYLKYVNEYGKKYGVRIYAFCLMGNHVHFVVQPNSERSMSDLFKVAHMKYSQYFNRKQDRKGHLWQGRFYSSMVVGAHVGEVFRYVENNPVRANLVRMAWHYSWSSARAHLGKKFNIIHLSDVKEHLDIDDWKAYLLRDQDEAVLKTIRDYTRKGKILGTDTFCAPSSIVYNKSVCP